MSSAKIIWTKIDEAPALATYAFLPIVQAYARGTGVDFELRDISLAGRILAELKDKAGGLALGPAAHAVSAPANGGGLGPAADDAVSALVNLGYGRSEAFGAVARASQALGDGAALESLVKAGLKELSA